MENARKGGISLCHLLSQQLCGVISGCLSVYNIVAVCVRQTRSLPWKLCIVVMPTVAKQSASVGLKKQTYKRDDQKYRSEVFLVWVIQLSLHGSFHRGLKQD